MIIGRFFKKKKTSEVFPMIQNDFSVVFFADTHNTLTENELDELESYDLSNLKAVIFLGDIGYNDFDKIKQREWYINENIKKIGVLGNHDEFGDLQQRNICDIQEEGIIDINGVLFGGFGGSIRYKNSNAPLLTDEESIILSQKMSSLDVLITHDGPKDKNRDFAHSGLAGINTYIETHHPAFHFYGHRHNPNIQTINNTTSICEYRVSLYQFQKSGVHRTYESITNYLQRFKDSL